MKAYSSVKSRQGAGQFIAVRWTSCSGRRPCLATLLLRYGAAEVRYGAVEPVLETRRANARVVAGGERLIVQLFAEVGCVDICDHRARILGCTQESSDELVETYPFGTGDFYRAVHRRPDCDVGHC